MKNIPKNLWQSKLLCFPLIFETYKNAIKKISIHLGGSFDCVFIFKILKFDFNVKFQPFPNLVLIDSPCLLMHQDIWLSLNKPQPQAFKFHFYVIVEKIPKANINCNNPNSLKYWCRAKPDLHKNPNVHQKVALAKLTFHYINTTNKYDFTIETMMVKNYQWW